MLGKVTKIRTDVKRNVCVWSNKLFDKNICLMISSSAMKIYASKNLKQYLRLSGLTNSEFANQIDYDKSTCSLMLNQRVACSSEFIASVMTQTGWKFESLFEIKEETNGRKKVKSR